MFTIFRLMALRSVRPCDLSQTMTKDSQIALYHCSKSLSWSNKSDSKRVVNVRRSIINSGGFRSRANVKVSSEWKDNPAQSTDSSQPVVPYKPRNVSKVTPTRAEKKISPELHALRLEDLPERNPKTFRTYKEDKPSVKGKQDDFVFGLAPCLMALTQGRRKVSTLFVKDGEGQQRDALQKVCEEAIKRDIEIKWIPKRELDKMTHGRLHQGVCLQASPLQYLREWSVRPNKTESPNQLPLWLVLDGIQDPMNLGAILRSAYFLGVDRIASSLENRYESPLYVCMYVLKCICSQ